MREFEGHTGIQNIDVEIRKPCRLAGVNAKLVRVHYAPHQGAHLLRQHLQSPIERFKGSRGWWESGGRGVRDNRIPTKSLEISEPEAELLATAFLASDTDAVRRHYTLQLATLDLSAPWLGKGDKVRAACRMHILLHRVGKAWALIFPCTVPWAGPIWTLDPNCKLPSKL